MKKVISWVVVLGVLAIVVLWVMNAYNSFVAAEEDVESSWAQVENQYQRRADLVPNLVATVKGYAAHEREALERVVEARSHATQMVVDPSNITPQQLMAYQSAQGELTQALGRLLALAERYPDLKANQNFLELQTQLEGTENRIAVARQNFNDVARTYNTKIRRFPNNIIARICNFEKRPYFESEQGASKAPKVEF